MFNWLKHHFIPHEGNDHQPHILRTEGAQILLFVLLASQALFLTYSFIILPSSPQVAAVLVPILISETNQERTQAHLSLLTDNELLMKSAQLKANDMAANGYFAHDSPTGEDPWYWFHKVGYDYRYAGENLAVNFVDSRDITDAWMNSPTHRENLLNAKYTQIGVATARGKYKGKDAIFVVQHFGTPLNDDGAATAFTVSGSAGGVSSGALARPEGQGTRVLGAESVNQAAVSIFGRISAQPRTLALLLELAIALIASTALLLAFFIRIRVQHPIIIANGLLVVSMTIGIALMNLIITRGSI